MKVRTDTESRIPNSIQIQSRIFPRASGGPIARLRIQFAQEPMSQRTAPIEYDFASMNARLMSTLTKRQYTGLSRAWDGKSTLSFLQSRNRSPSPAFSEFSATLTLYIAKKKKTHELKPNTNKQPFTFTFTFFFFTIELCVEK
jgi:hypothetical protein